MSDVWIDLEADGDVVEAWKSGLAMGRRLGFDSPKQNCLSGLILELGRDVVGRGGKGRVGLSDASDPQMLRARVVIECRGAEVAPLARERLNAELRLGPWQPPVRLRQALESFEIVPSEQGGTVKVTINQPRARLRTSNLPPRASL
jgi:hypothetical protein